MRRPILVIAVLLLGIALVSLARQERARAPVPGESDPGRPYRHGQRALGAAVAIEPLRTDARYRRRFLDTFVSLTPENAMKWELLAPREGVYEFGPADAIVDWAQSHRKRVRGHPLVWDQQLPAWLGAGEHSAEELAQLVRDHVRRVVSRYRGRVESWDVVNEPLEDDGSWTRNVFFARLGRRYVEIAFRAARAADPDARLFLNEIAAELPGPKQDALVALARDLRRRGVPIDGVGLQNHTQTGDAPSGPQLERTLGRFTRLRLDVELTEMDVVIAPGGSEAQQAAAFADAAGACRAVARCTGLTVWGVTDATSWLGAAKRPLLYDSAGEAKPALESVLRAWGG